MLRAIKLGLAIAGVLASLACTGGQAKASTVYQEYNEGEPNPAFFWGLPSIGWYWTPATNLELEGIQTQLTSGFFNINNNFTFTTELFTDRPAAGGTSLGSFTWNGITFVDGPWLGGSFSSAISLTGGTTYFVGMTGWQDALDNTPGGGAGVNWTFPILGGEDHIGLGASWGDADGTLDFDDPLNPLLVPEAVTEFPIPPLHCR